MRPALPTEEQLRARLQGLLDCQRMTTIELAGLLGLTVEGLRQRLRLRGLSNDLAVYYATAIMARFNPAGLDPIERAAAEQVARERLVAPVLSPQLLNTLRIVRDGRVPGPNPRYVAKSRLRALALEGMIEAIDGQPALTDLGRVVLEQPAAG